MQKKLKGQSSLEYLLIVLVSLIVVVSVMTFMNESSASSTRAADELMDELYDRVDPYRGDEQIDNGGAEEGDTTHWYGFDDVIHDPEECHSGDYCFQKEGYDGLTAYVGEWVEIDPEKEYRLSG